MSIFRSWNGQITLPTVRIKGTAVTTAFPLEEKSQSMRCGRTRIRILLLRRSKDTSRSIPTESMKSRSNFNHARIVKRNSTMKVALDKGQFGPWALVTGASSGIGKEFARQIAASGINVVLVARREALLAELGRAISQEFDVQYRALAMDLSQEGFIAG